MTDEITATDGVMTLVSDGFEVGETYKVSSGTASTSAMVTEAGKLEVTFDSLALGTLTVVCKTEGKEITFTNVNSTVEQAMATVAVRCLQPTHIIRLQEKRRLLSEKAIPSR